VPELFVYLSGLLLTIGAYLVLQPGLVRILFGVVLVGNAMNLAILAVGRTQGRPPVIPPGAAEALEPMANPLPQALVLTALVISFGLTAFALALIGRVHGTIGTLDVRAVDPQGPDSSENTDPPANRGGGRGGRVQGE
jgi:multicomponent Na+:H+ antiporter subunit C